MPMRLHVQLVPLPTGFALSQWQTCTDAITAPSTLSHAGVPPSATLRIHSPHSTICAVVNVPVKQCWFSTLLHS